MDVTANVDHLISRLQIFKSAIPSMEPAEVASEFDALFADAAIKLDRPVSDTDFAAPPEDIGMAPAAEPSALVFAELMTQSWLTDRQSDAISARPNMLEFMEATGVSASDASELLYGVIGSNADLRDWSKIMASDNPLDAARAATSQLYNSDKEYALVNHLDYGTTKFDETLAASSLSSKTVLSQSGNFADIGTEVGNGATTAVSSTGLLLRGAGTTQEQIQRTAWLFGFDVPEIYARSA